MASGRQIAEENVQTFAAWVATKSDTDYRAMVIRGVLSRTEIAKECGFAKSALGLLKNKAMMTRRKDAMERMGAAYMANGIVTLAGSRLYTSLADNDEVIADALNRFESVFSHVVNTGER